MIIPDGILYLLPFETLRLGKTSSMLVEQLEVTYAPSTTSLIQLVRTRNNPKGEGDVLIIGRSEIDVDNSRSFDSGKILEDLFISMGFDFTPLPFIGKEINKVERSFSKGTCSILQKDRATEEVFKSLALDRFNLIHFACHSFHDTIVPLRSSLILGQEGVEDGFLQAREILQLNIKADMVVMSGCQTGRGSIASGEGVIGLPRVFFYAGAKSVLSSLWPVSDEASAEFMGQFYSNLARGLGRSRSLRLAKIKMLETRFKHPFFWAPYVLYGDPQFDRPAR